MTDIMTDKTVHTYASYDPSINPSPVLGWYDFDFSDYPNVDKSTLAPMPEPNWSKRTESQWIVKDGEVIVYVPPLPTQDELIVTARAHLASIRYSHEIAGVSFQASDASSPSIVASDRDSQSKLIAAYVLASSGMWVDGTAWKMQDGSFVDLTATDAVKMTLTVQGYVASCFAFEKIVGSKLSATTNADDLAAIDLNAGWPDNGPSKLAPTTTVAPTTTAAPITPAPTTTVTPTTTVAPTTTATPTPSNEDTTETASSSDKTDADVKPSSDKTETTSP